MNSTLTARHFEDQNSPTRELLRQHRIHRTELKRRMDDVLCDLNSIAQFRREGRCTSPLNRVSKLKEDDGALFSNVPEQFVEGPRAFQELQKNLAGKAKSGSKLKSTVEGNKKWSREVSRRNKKARNSDPAAIVHIDRPLDLGWDAKRKTNPEIFVATHKNANSILAGFFSKNAKVHQGVEQAPLPEAYKPNPNGRRFIIKRKQEDAAAKNIPIDKHRKAQILEVPEKEPLKPVPKDFVPTCYTRSSTDSGRRVEVFEKYCRIHSLEVGDRPFH